MDANFEINIIRYWKLNGDLFEYTWQAPQMTFRDIFVHKWNLFLIL